MRGKTNLTQLLKLLTINLPLGWSDIIERLPKKVCSLMQSFFMKKVSPYFVVGEETLRFIFKSFPISKSSSLTLVVQTMTFQAKLPGHCF